MTLYSTSSFFSRRLNGVFLYLSRLIISRHERFAESVLGANYGHPLRYTSICNPKEALTSTSRGRSFARSREGPRVATSSDDPFSFSADKSLSCRDYSALLVGNPFRASPRTAIRRSPPPPCPGLCSKYRLFHVNFRGHA